MTPRLVGWLALVVIAAGCDRAPDAVTLTYRAPPAGTSFTVSTTAESKLSYVEAGKPVSEVSRSSAVIDIAILEATADQIVRSRETYRSGTGVSERDGRTTEQPRPLLGKSFLLERRGDQIVRTDERGGPLSAAETEAVGSDGSMGEPPPVLRQLAGRPLARGVLVELSPEQLAAYAAEGIQGSSRMTRFAVRFTGMRGELAVLETEAELVGEGRRATTRDTLVIDPATCAVHDLHSRSTMSSSGEPSITATFDLTMKRVPLEPAAPAR